MSLENSTRPLPKQNAYMDNTPFWQATAEKRLVIQFCRDSGQPQFFPRPLSLKTGRRNIEWRNISGRGTVYSFTNTFNPWPGHESRAPYLCALIDLDEGVRILSNLYNVDADQVEIGMRVRIFWEKLSDSVVYPAFEPA